MTRQGYKHQTGEVLQRVKTMADYIRIDQKGISKLVQIKNNPDSIKELLRIYAIEDWVPHILDAYDPVCLALAEEILKRNAPMAKQKLLKDLGMLKDEGDMEEIPTTKPIKRIDVKGYKGVKGYQRTSVGRYKNKERTKLFISSRVGMDNKRLTKEYNDWATKNGYPLRTISAITTLKSRIKSKKW